MPMFKSHYDIVCEKPTFSTISKCVVDDNCWDLTVLFSHSLLMFSSSYLGHTHSQHLISESLR